VIELYTNQQIISNYVNECSNIHTDKQHRRYANPAAALQITGVVQTDECYGEATVEVGIRLAPAVPSVGIAWAHREKSGHCGICTFAKNIQRLWSYDKSSQSLSVS
jgi:hypothetical protein